MDENLEKVRFIDEKRLSRVIEKELESEETAAKKNEGFGKMASNPIKTALMKFVHVKEKFNLKDF